MKIISQVAVVSNRAKETFNIGRALAENLQKGDIICLFGQLGTGKTVLTKGIAQGLGIQKNRIVSPSFVLLRQHNSAKFPFYHFDLYRLNDPRGIAAIGYEEYFYGEGVSVIEWADRLKYLLPKEYLKIELSIKSDVQRLLEFRAFGRHYQELLERTYIGS